jgi:hypothetical protein
MSAQWFVLLQATVDALIGGLLRSSGHVHPDLRHVERIREVGDRVVSWDGWPAQSDWQIRAFAAFGLGDVQFVMAMIAVDPVSCSERLEGPFGSRDRGIESVRAMGALPDR